MKILNPFTLPLNNGINLIEASAGTGKTFTISLLYLRLLLGLGDKNSYYRPLSVEEILVVTFTESATIELRNSIYKNINQLLKNCIYNKDKKGEKHTLLQEIIDPLNSAKLLLIAKNNINKASIFTIHSFCQRMLNFYVFEFNAFFKKKIIENEDPLLKEAIINFWCTNFYPLNIEIINLILSEFSSPYKLLKIIKPWIYRKDISILNSSILDNETIISRHKNNISLINKMKCTWNIYNHLVEKLIISSDIDKRCYNNKYLLLWIDIINKWSNSETYNYFYPKELNKFSQEILQKKTKIEKKVPYHNLFYEIQIFLNYNLSLRDIIIYKSLIEVRNLIFNSKINCSLIGFNDLLSILNDKLNDPEGFLLSAKIRDRFPVAMIDEFQDTDLIQYNIFHKIYNNQSKYSLLLIGDPKQSIYSFRGSDIFTYINARNKVDNIYTMNINWRASSNMVNSINKLFSLTKYPFIFHNIPFIKINSSIKNQKLKFIVNAKEQNALNIWVQYGNEVNFNDYYKYMSKQCAINISKLINSIEQKNAFLIINEKKRLLQISDIVVLVRNSYEASLIYGSLKSLSILSVYLSNEKSIYHTIEAKEILWLLKAIINPKKNILLRRALSTNFFSLNLYKTEHLIKNHKLWIKLVNNFIFWKKLWYKYNLVTMLHNVINKNNFVKKILSLQYGKLKLNNLFYLIEILQKFSTKNKNPYELIRFLEKQINNPNNQLFNQNLILDNNIIRIITIHKSKGSQYPIIWIPFPAVFRQASTALYYDQKNYITNLDLQSSDKNIKIADKERLSEDLRLLYVALTRAIFHCNIGIAPIILGKRKKTENNTSLHLSAIGYLIQNTKVMSSLKLNEELVKLGDEKNIKIIQQELFIDNDKEYKLFKESISCQNYDNYKSSIVYNSWKTFDLNKIILYRNKKFLCNNYNYYPKIRIVNTCLQNYKNSQKEKYLDFITFNKFFHNLLSNINFNNPINIKLVKINLSKFGYSKELLNIIITWIDNIFHVKLNTNGIVLSVLKKNDLLINFSFFIHIKKKINILDINNMIYSYYKSNYLIMLNSINLQGMLSGCIDLIFKWNNKYYILDYKLDYLGEEKSRYEQKNINKYMFKTQYHLQYHIYALSLHRHLKLRLMKYDYEKDFGGIFYLFVQGIEKNSDNYGIFYVKPPYLLIHDLDKIFN